MAATKRSSSSKQTGKWDGLRSDCIATRAKGIYATHRKEQQDAFWKKLGVEKRLAASAKRSLIPSAFEGKSGFKEKTTQTVTIILHQNCSYLMKLLSNTLHSS